MDDTPTRRRLLDEAYALVAAGQQPDAADVRVRIEDLVVHARGVGEVEGECVALFAAAAAAMWSDEPTAAEMVERLVTRAEQLGRTPWHATGIALRASRRRGLDEILVRLDDLATAVVLLDPITEDSRAVARAYNSIAIAYGADRLWELAEEHYDRAAAVAAAIGDADLTSGLLLNRVALALDESLDLLEAGAAQDARRRASLAAGLGRQLPSHAARPYVATDVGWRLRGLADVAGGARLSPDDLETEVVASHVALIAAAGRRTVDGDHDAAAALLAVLDADALVDDEPQAARALLWLRARVAGRGSTGDVTPFEDYVELLASESRDVRRAVLAAGRSSLATRRARSEHERLRRASLEDPLTGIGNRRRYDALIAERRTYEVGLAVVDIDDFKQVNDVHGHQVGDDVLVRVAAAIRGALRSADEVCRLGGDEFAVVLATSSIAVARSIAERLHAAVRDVDWSQIAAGLAITVSVGVAIAPADEVYRRADQALYLAKDRGRDRVAAGV